MNINESLSQEQKIELFRSLFKGREDVFAQRWESSDGQRSAYYPAYTNRDKTDYLPLSDWMIEEHLRGNRVIGVIQSNKTTHVILLQLILMEKAGKMMSPI